MEAPIPVGGFYGGRQDFLVLAAIRAGDLARAEDYVKRLNWSAEVAPEERRAADDWSDGLAVVRTIGARGNVNWDFVAAVYGRFAGLKDGLADRVYGQQIIVRAGAEYWVARLNESGEDSLGDAMKRGGNAVGAASYWPDQIVQVGRALIREPLQLDHLAPLVEDCGKEFAIHGYGHGFWMRLAREQAITGDFGLRLGYLRRAVAAAENDAQRTDGIAGMAQVYRAFGRSGEGAKAVDELKASVSEAAQRMLLERLSRSLAAEPGKDIPPGGNAR